MRARSRGNYRGNNLPACTIVPTTCERGRHSGAMSAMDLPRTPKSGASSAVPEVLFQKSQVPHEKVPRDRWASPGIVDWSRLRDFRERRSKIESVASQKRHMWDVEGTIDPAGVLGFLWNDCRPIRGPREIASAILKAIPTRNRKAIAAQLFLVSGSPNQVGSSISMARTKKGLLRLESGVTSDFRCLMGHVVQRGLNMGTASHC